MVETSESQQSEDSPPFRPGLLARNVLWLTGGEFVSRLIAFGVAVYLARKLGAGDFGAIGIALAVVNYLIIGVDAGMDPVGIREVARDPQQLPRVFRHIVGVRLAAALAMYAVLGLLAFWLPGRAIGGRDLALVFGARLFTYALKVDWALKGREEMKIVAFGVIIQHLVYAAGILYLIRGPEIALILVPAVHVAAELVLALVYLLWLRAKYSRLWGSGSRTHRARFVRESLPIGLGKGLRLLYYEGDMLLLGWLSTSEQAGYFLVSHKIILSLVALAVLYQQNAFPALSRMVLADPLRGARFQQAVSRYALLWSVPVGAAGIYLGPSFIETLFGPAYRSSAPIFAIMLFTLPLMLISAGLYNQLLAHGRSKSYLHSVLLGGLVHVGLGVFLAPTWGAVGAAQASLAGECVAFLVAAYCVWADQGVAPLCRRSLSVVLAGCLMVAVMLPFRDMPFLPLALLGGAAYVIGVILLGGVRPDEFRRLSKIWG